ncbi:hypothetical protein DM860_002258 [Cuscuta australis]|uniref:Peptidase A1 domain-containing protein n=1 Tax=Cuscuta australis TaxID=267555 RepID=A0A328CZZ8_9ASTE|nr:hypothetical protein DM860_002258 [Cuscuta australis]
MIRRMVNVGSYNYYYYMFPSLPLLLLAFCLATPLLLPPAAAVATTLFDVESSLQETLHVGQPPGERGLSYDEVVVDEDDRRHRDPNKQSFPSSGYSVVLQPRSAVFPTSYPDYRSLTLARLKRDSARAKWIQARLDLAAGRTTMTEEVSSEVTSGAGSGSNEYLALVGIGGAKFHLALDTGSELTWLQCLPCDQCYPQTDPIFVPSQSPTYSPLPCHAGPCPSPTHFSSQCGWNHTCRYTTVYGDTSTSQGDLAKESVTLGGDGSDPLPNITIGCGRNNPGMLAGGPAGIMGLNGGSLSFTTQIGATSFSYCLVDKDDTTHSSTLDFFVAPKVDDVAVVAPLMKTGGFYQIGLVGISVGGAPVTSITGDVIVDSGTVVSQLHGDAYNSVREALVANVNLTSRPQVGPMDTCFDLSGVNITMAVPPVSFQFSNGQELKLPAKNYMTPVDSSGTHCLAFAAATTPYSIIGNVQQQGIRVTYDLAGSVFRFTPGNC